MAFLTFTTHKQKLFQQKKREFFSRFMNFLFYFVASAPVNRPSCHAGPNHQSPFEVQNNLPQLFSLLQLHLENHSFPVVRYGNATIKCIRKTLLIIKAISLPIKHYLRYALQNGHLLRPNQNFLSLDYAARYILPVCTPAANPFSP
jgi:hypothetical protein